MRAAVDAINLAIEGLPDDIHVSVHVCQGNYAVGPDYDGQIGHRYFDTGRYKADLVCRIDCDAYLIEHDMTGHYEGLLGNKQLGVGAVDVQAPNVETGEQIADRIRAYPWLAPEQTIITSSCGFNHLPAAYRLGQDAGDERGEIDPARLAVSGATWTRPSTAGNTSKDVCARPRSGSAWPRSPAGSAGSSGICRPASGSGRPHIAALFGFRPRSCEREILRLGARDLCR